MNEFDIINSNLPSKSKKNGNRIDLKIEKIKELNLFLVSLKADLDYLIKKYIHEIQSIETKIIEIEMKEIRYLDKVFDENILSKRDNKLLSELILKKISAIADWVENSDILFIQEKHLFYFQKYNKQETELEFEEIEPIANPNDIGQNEIVSKSRKIYLELAKKFHPDLSSNAKEELENTHIMQEVTAAYQENDWIKLVNLKSKLLHSEASIKQTDEDLAKILDQNLAAIEHEIELTKQKGNHFFPEHKLFDKDFPKRRLSIDILVRAKHKEMNEFYKQKKKSVHFYNNAAHVSQMIDYYRKFV